MNSKRIAFSIILATPVALLIAVGVYLAMDIREIRAIDPGALTAYYRGVIAQRESVSFALPANIARRPGADATVFAFGSSDLLLSDGASFPSYLDTRHPGLQVVNFGVHGIDSFLVRQRVQDALAVARPDVIVVYYGHNEYNGAYQGYVLPSFFDQFGVFNLLTYPYHLLRKPAAVPVPSTYYWHTRLRRHAYFALFERLGLIEVRNETFSGVNREILDFFKKNHAAVIAIAKEFRIPVVFVTPIGNLRAEPWGSIRTTASLYRKGLQTGDYQLSMDYLTAAKDTEIFTYDLRAKSELIDHIRASKARNVHVLDLERVLRSRRFGFDGRDFLDYVHLSDRSHRLIADILYDYLLEEKLLGSTGTRVR